MEKPDFILNFKKPKNTEIKHINGHWYLYERSNVYDREIHRSRKKSGKLLGKITENGLVESNKRKIEKQKLQNDVVEFGASDYFLNLSQDMKESLQKHFPDMWEEIYVISILRAIYGGRFKRLNLHFEDSFLSYLFKNVNLNKRQIHNLLAKLGRQRSAIADFMQENVNEDDRFILFDGHRLLSSAKNMDNAELGYDSKRRYKPQINLLYLFSMGANTGSPVYYKQFMGSTPDVTAFKDIMHELGQIGKNCTMVSDKGFASDENFDLLEENDLKYIVPLKRGNLYVKGKVPNSPAEYEHFFEFNERAIVSKVFEHDNYNIHLFFDAELMSDEMRDLVQRTEKKNNTIEIQRNTEFRRIQKGKGRLTQEELEKLAPLTIKEMFENKAEIGIITIKTNRKDLNSLQVYSIFKQRQAIEQFFKTYSDTMDFEASYMKDNYCEEAWLFLNHLSSILGIRAIENIYNVNQSKNVSIKDLTQTLSKIKLQISRDYECSLTPIKKSVMELCKKLDYIPRYTGMLQSE